MRQHRGMALDMRWMTVLVALGSLMAALFGCRAGHDRGTAQSAFAALSTCVDSGDAQCLYEFLDRDSRWSLQTIHRTVLAMRTLVENSYPKEARLLALGSFTGLSRTQSPAQCFAAYCTDRRCMDLLLRGFGAVERQEVSGSRVILETVRQGRFPMVQTEEGFGLALYSADLSALKLRALDTLAEIERNAKEYEEQRLAAGRQS